MNIPPLLLAILMLLGGILSLVLFAIFQNSRLLRRFPGVSPENIQQRWNTRKARMRAGVFMVFAVMAALTYALFQPPFDRDFRVAYLVPAAALFIIGAIFGEMCVNVWFATRLKEDSWGLLQSCRFCAGLVVMLRRPFILTLVAGVATQQLALAAGRGYDSTGWNFVVGYLWIAVWILGGLLLSLLPGPLWGIRKAPPELQAEVDDLARRAGIKKPIACVVLPETGGKVALGLASKRIYLARHLIDNLAPDELKAVIAHELAHVRLGHIRRRGRIAAVLYLLGAGLIVLVGRNEYLLWVQRGELLPLAAAYAPMYLAIGMKKRLHRDEFDCDRFAAELLGDPAPMIGALETIHQLAILPRKFPGEKVPTHPSLDLRIESLRKVPSLTPPTSS